MRRLPTIDEYGEDEFVAFKSKLEELKNGQKNGKATIQTTETNTGKTTTQKNETVDENATIQTTETNKKSDEKSQMDRERMMRKFKRKEKRDRKIIRMLTKTMERKRSEAAKRRLERIKRKSDSMKRRSGSENPLTKLKNRIVAMVKNLTRRSHDSTSFVVFFVDPSNVGEFVNDAKIRA